MRALSTLTRQLPVRKAVIAMGTDHADCMSGVAVAKCLEDAIKRKVIDPKRIAFGFETLVGFDPKSEEWKMFDGLLKKHGKAAYLEAVKEVAAISSSTRADITHNFTCFATYPILQLLHDHNIPYDMVDSESFTKAVSKKKSMTSYKDGTLLEWDNERIIAMLGGVSKFLTEKDIVFTYSGAGHLPALAARCDFRLNTDEVSTSVQPVFLSSQWVAQYNGKEYSESVAHLRHLMQKFVVEVAKHNDNPLERQLTAKALDIISNLVIAKPNEQAGGRHFENDSFEKVLNAAVAFTKRTPSPSPAVSANEGIAGTQKSGKSL